VEVAVEDEAVPEVLEALLERGGVVEAFGHHLRLRLRAERRMVEQDDGRAALHFGVLERA
jgi:hypothetical protein